MTDPRQRFSSRVADYRLYRPDYPAGVFRALASRIPPSDGVAVADIGSGTGIFTRQLLETGYRVTAVEPNGDMARVAEEELSGNPRFT